MKNIPRKTGVIFYSRGSQNLSPAEQFLILPTQSVRYNNLAANWLSY